jgi:hypothetical protein
MMTIDQCLARIVAIPAGPDFDTKIDGAVTDYESSYRGDHNEIARAIEALVKAVQGADFPTKGRVLKILEKRMGIR